MAPCELPEWPRIILTIFTVLSFLPQLYKVSSSRDSSGISPYYVLSNVLLATHHFSIYFALCVNEPSGGGVVVHNPPNTADLLNLTHLFVAWLLFLLLFVLTLLYLSTDDLPQRGIVALIYIGFLMISVIPQFYEAIGGFDDLAKSELEWRLLFFVAGHLLIVNPVLTIVALVSAGLQARRILQGPIHSSLSVPGLAGQAAVFAVLAVSWVWRVVYGGSPRFPADNAVLDWYFKFGWPVVGIAVFAIVQFVLLWVVIQRQRSVTVPFEERETEPLLGGSLRECHVEVA
ncbi:uncharacterized protein BDV17DRAFT_104301 [Aspergillus undulatus]|uniref:uncharacterized protein n=1 Tax=Aspergillus undulatus TaxID=1810928 RepID=UPI003CCCC56F